MQVTALHNPNAGDAGLTRRELIDLLEGAGYDVTYQSVKESGWDEALETPGDFVVAAGGDGTVAKAARKLVGRKVPLAVLPLGTANNLARSLGITGDHAAVARRWQTATPRGLDLGVLESPDGPRHFVEAVGIGVFPCLLVESERRKKELEDASPEEELVAGVELTLELLRRASPVACAVTADDRDLSGDYLAVEIMNARSLGSRLELAPSADPCDGMFEVVCITERERKPMIRFLEQLRDHGRGEVPVQPVRARHIEVAGLTSMLHIDDEVWPRPKDLEKDEVPTPFRVTVDVLPGAVAVLL